MEGDNPLISTGTRKRLIRPIFSKVEQTRTKSLRNKLTVLGTIKEQSRNRSTDDHISDQTIPSKTAQSVRPAGHKKEQKPFFITHFIYSNHDLQRRTSLASPHAGTSAVKERRLEKKTEEAVKQFRRFQRPGIPLDSIAIGRQVEKACKSLGEENTLPLFSPPLEVNTNVWKKR